MFGLSRDDVATLIVNITKPAFATLAERIENLEKLALRFDTENIKKRFEVIESYFQRECEGITIKGMARQQHKLENRIEALEEKVESPNEEICLLHFENDLEARIQAPKAIIALIIKACSEGKTGYQSSERII